MIRVACTICKTERLVYPSRVKTLQLCSDPFCYAEAKRTGLIPAGGRPARPIVVQDGVEGLQCKGGHWAPLSAFYLHAANPAHGHDKPWRFSRCIPCMRARERDLERGHRHRRRVERLADARPVARTLALVPPPAFDDDLPLGEW